MANTFLVSAGASAVGVSVPITVPVVPFYDPGDLLVIYATMRNTGRGIGIPSGWVKLTNDLDDQHVLLGKIAGSSETSVTLPLGTGSGAGNVFLGQMAAFRSDEGWPETLANCAVSTSAKTTSDLLQEIPIPAYSVPGTNQMVILLGHKLAEFEDVEPPTDEWLEIGQASTSLGNDGAQTWAVGIRSSDDYTDPQTFSATGGTVGTSWGAVVVIEPSGVITSGDGTTSPGTISAPGRATARAHLSASSRSSGGGSKSVAFSPGAVLNIGTKPGQNHFSVQVAPNGASNYVTHTLQEIESGYEENPYFMRTSDKTRVQLWARMDGPTTGGSPYARSELRENTIAGDKMKFDAMDSGTHWIKGRTRIMHLPPVKPEVTIVQLHDGDTDRFSMRTTLINGILRLNVRVQGKAVTPYMEQEYKVGTEFSWMLKVQNGVGYMYYNDMTTPIITHNSLVQTVHPDGWYFKTGSYNQSNDTIDTALEYVQVELSQLQHWHTGWPQPQASGSSTVDTHVTTGVARMSLNAYNRTVRATSSGGGATARLKLRATSFSTGGIDPVGYKNPGEALNIGPRAGQNHFSVQVSPEGSAVVVTHTQAEIAAGYDESPVFTLTADRTRVAMLTRMDGATTPNTAYARSELREQDQSGTNYGFNYATGTHWIRGRTRITHLPPNKPEIMVAQVHDANSDRIAIRTQVLSGATMLIVSINGANVTPRLDTSYTVGDEFEWMIKIVNGTGYVYYNDMTKPFITTTALTATAAGATDWYFKAGDYNLSNASLDDPDEFGSVELSRLQHWHTGWPTPDAIADGPAMETHTTAARATAQLVADFAAGKLVTRANSAVARLTTNAVGIVSAREISRTATMRLSATATYVHTEWHYTAAEVTLRVAASGVPSPRHTNAGTATTIASATSRSGASRPQSGTATAKLSASGVVIKAAIRENTATARAAISFTSTSRRLTEVEAKALALAPAVSAGVHASAVSALARLASAFVLVPVKLTTGTAPAVVSMTWRYIAARITTGSPSLRVFMTHEGTATHFSRGTTTGLTLTVFAQGSSSRETQRKTLLVTFGTGANSSARYGAYRAASQLSATFLATAEHATAREVVLHVRAKAKSANAHPIVDDFLVVGPITGNPFEAEEVHF